jgi:hypothetical protein
VIALAATGKLIAGLGLALALSLGANAWQLYRAGIASGEAAGAAERQQLADDNSDLRVREAVSLALAGQAADDNAGLVAQLDAIAERSRQVRIVYRTAAAAAPLAAGCAPGPERMDAVNQGLGPKAAP